MKLDLESRRVNLALLKPTKMTSQHAPFVSSRAVDGNREGGTNLKTCSATEVKATKSWWQVDLQGVYVITDVIITNGIGNGELLFHWEPRALRSNGHLGSDMGHSEMDFWRVSSAALQNMG